MHGIKKITAILMSVLIVLVLTVYVGFIAENENHIHDHSGAGGACSTCVHISAAEKVINALGTVTATAAISFAVCVFACHITKSSVTSRGLNSLFSLRVKLNN
jgi:hypothetical protein